jgi:hypothetical protein
MRRVRRWLYGLSRLPLPMRLWPDQMRRPVPPDLQQLVLVDNCWLSRSLVIHRRLRRGVGQRWFT